MERMYFEMSIEAADFGEYAFTSPERPDGIDTGFMALEFLDENGIEYEICEDEEEIFESLHNAPQADDRHVIVTGEYPNGDKCLAVVWTKSSEASK